MLTLTHDAAETIRQLTEGPAAEGVRISSAAPSANGEPAPLQIQLAAGPSADDAVIDAEGAQLYLDGGAMEVLDDKVLHADVQEGEVRFAILEAPEQDDQPE